MSVDSVNLAVQDRYSQAAQNLEPALCCPVANYDKTLLEAIPDEVLERDYGCGDPSRFVQPGDTVLDLGSGGGKICFIASQIVGRGGKVIGLDRNREMLELAEWAKPLVAEKQDFFKQSLERLDKQFKATASELLVNTGERLSKQQGSKLDDIIKPFRENLTRFEKEFKTAYDKETREQISLKEQIKNLSELNAQLSGEAHALANALKGDSKIRGNWGEQMLEHILQSSGLREGHEYQTQASYTGEDGSRLQPDVIINLPDDKCIIVDSKVTLNSWMDFVNAETDEIRQQQIKTFTLAVHQHVKSLSSKAYHKIYDIKTLDFVLMFIPIETAFLYALQTDSSLYDEAHKLNIILVSPTTLMAVLKTIAVNWKYDRQEKNTLRIAKEAEKLLDKIHNYMESLLKARNSLTAASNHMDTAVKRFVSGKGNIKDSTDKLKQLGVKSAKKMGIEWENIEAEADEQDAIEHADDETDEENE